MTLLLLPESGQYVKFPCENGQRYSLLRWCVNIKEYNDKARKLNPKTDTDFTLRSCSRWVCRFDYDCRKIEVPIARLAANNKLASHWIHFDIATDHRVNYRLTSQRIAFRVTSKLIQELFWYQCRSIDRTVMFYSNGNTARPLSIPRSGENHWFYRFTKKHATAYLLLSLLGRKGWYDIPMRHCLEKPKSL
jgi:hypothetical protein